MTTYPVQPHVRLASMISGNDRALRVTKQQAVLLKSAMSAATPQPWTALTLQNGWVSVSGYIPAQWRQSAAGTVEVIGVIGGGAIADGTVIAALPSGMFNISHAWPFPAVILSGASAASDDTPLVTAQANGNLRLSGIPAGTTQLSFHDFVPLNA